MAVGKPEQIRLKALGGIFFNLLIVIICGSHDRFVAQIIVTNLLVALCSLCDLDAFITGVADYLYCGNFGLIALRKSDDENALLPSRMLDIALKMGRETEVRGGQGGGGLVIGKNGDRTVFVGKKIVNRKRGNLTESLEAKFAPIRNKALARGVKPLESSIVGVWHYHYSTRGTAPSELETHWHEWIGAKDREVWRFTDGEWLNTTKNVHHRITHNGDFDSWQIFNRQVDNITLGLWLERVLHTPNVTKGDSPKIAGMMDLLVTQGMWYPSVRLAYQQAIATSIEEAFDGQKPTADSPNTAPIELDLNVWAGIFENVFTTELTKLKLSDINKITPKSLQSSTNLRQNLIRAFKSHSSTQNWSQMQTITFVQCTLQAFFNNDLYRELKFLSNKLKAVLA